MCYYVNLRSHPEIVAQKQIANDHEKMLKEASMNMLITDQVRTLVTGYHRSQKQIAEKKIQKLGGIPTDVATLIHSDSLRTEEAPHAH